MTIYIYDPGLTNHELLEIAKKFSRDPVRKVGAILLFPDGSYYYGFNYIENLNDLEPGDGNHVAEYIWKKNRNLGRLIANHAERTSVWEAVMDGKTDFTEASMLVSLAPCDHCRQIIETAGIKTVMFAEYYVPTQL